MPFNMYAILVASLVTLVIGFIWYNPKVFGTIWMNETGMTEEKAKKGNMAKVFGLTILYSLMFALMMPTIVIHQSGVLSSIGGPDFIETAKPSYAAFMNDYGDTFRTFKHGVFHGVLASIFFVLPIVAINSLFEQRSWKYILITFGYWMVTMAIMGGIICAWK